MNRRVVIGGVVLVVVIVAGIGTAIVGVGSVSALFGDEEPQPPALTWFESAGAHCTDDFMANSSTIVVGGGANTEITYSRNISLPSPSYAVGGPTFERVNESTYQLSIPIDETEKAPRECPGVARYNASMRIPAGDGLWRVIITHDGRNVTTLFGDSDSSGVGGSVSSGASVSDG